MIIIQDFQQRFNFCDVFFLICAILNAISLQKSNLTAFLYILVWKHALAIKIKCLRVKIQILAFINILITRCFILTQLSHCAICVVVLQEIRSQLENCLADGSPLLVTDCDIEKLAKDTRFRYAIQKCTDFIHGKNRFKIIVSMVCYEKINDL